jgi:dolichyl-phosphate beta-glucosyltransferase
MRRLDSPPPDGLAPPTLDVSLLIPARSSAHALEGTVVEARRYLASRFERFEIVLIPNPGADAATDRSGDVARSLATRFPEVKVVPHEGIAGKGAALRTGFLASRGRWVFFTDADLPYELDFFDEAALRLRQGYGLVTGNRRVGSSQFEMPVSLLPLAYGRHRLGLGFNRMARTLLPIRSGDTQAGIKAMSRDLAQAAFSRQRCPGFFFDLELFLTAANDGYLQTELPVRLHLNSEKSTVRVLREGILATFWLFRIALGQRLGAYGKAPERLRVRTRYQASGLTRLFLRLRWAFTPYARMASKAAPEGKILDLGCGHGLLALTAALQSPRRQVLGVDHDEARIAMARAAAQGIPNARFETALMLPFPEGAFRGIFMIDVLHYFDPQAQEELLKGAWERLEPGGVVIVREVNPHGGFASWFNRFYEKVATGIGFTRSRSGTHHSFKSVTEWEDLISRQGFRVSSMPCSSILFSDHLFIGEKGEKRSGGMP